MSTSLKVAEIVVRVIVIVVQILGVIGGGFAIVLLPNTSSDAINSLHYGIGGTIVAISGLILIYEVIMIVLSFIKKVNHSARLLVDVIVSSLMIALCTCMYATAIAFVIILVLAIIFILVADIRLLFPLPIAFGILSSIVFIMPAIVSAFIRSKIINQSRRETSQPAPDPAGTTTDTESAPDATSTMIQLPSSNSQAINGAGSSSDPPPAYYTTVAGEGGDFSQNAHSYPTAGTGVEQPYYSQAQPGLGGSVATVSGDDSPQNAYDYPAVSVAGGGGVDADDSYYSRALHMEPGVTVAVAVGGANETGHDEPPSYVSIIA